MPRTTLAYDDIVGFNQTVPDTTEGDLYTAYQPYLKVVNGCVPFPAVDAEGDIRFVTSLHLSIPEADMEILAVAFLLLVLMETLIAPVPPARSMAVLLRMETTMLLCILGMYIPIDTYIMARITHG